MISGRMVRRNKVLLTVLAVAAISLLTSACGTERIKVPKSNQTAYAGALLFSERCSGCHTLSFAGTHGSAQNVRDRQEINGPDFDQRCERPIARVLYAIENGGFSGAYMPANVVIGKQAREVATFVAEYSGTQEELEPGEKACQKDPIGSLPPSGAGADLSDLQPSGPLATKGTATSTSTTSTSTSATVTSATSSTPSPSVVSSPTTATTPTTSSTPSVNANGTSGVTTKGPTTPGSPTKVTKKKSKK
jgi:mono/diheme cytochrome c family protein